MGLPLLVRAAQAGFEQVDRRYEQIAATLGAGPVRVFFTVSLPLAGRGVAAGALLGFSRALGEFGATITFVSSIPDETRTLPIALYGLAQVPGGEAAALRIVVISIVLAVAALLASEVAARRLRSRSRG